MLRAESNSSRARCQRRRNGEVMVLLPDTLALIELIRDKRIPRRRWISTRGDLESASFLFYAKRHDSSWTQERVSAALKCWQGKCKSIKDNDGKELCALGKAKGDEGRSVHGDDGTRICHGRHWCLGARPVILKTGGVLGVSGLRPAFKALCA